MHFKRNKIEKFWPVPRKGTKYLAVPKHDQYKSIPLVVAVRDVFKLVENKKELKRLLNEKKVLINHKEIREANYPVALFDVISFVDSKENYKALLSKHKKIIFEKVFGKESETKTFKVINKKILPGKIIQLNLNHGKNINSKEKAKVGDSIVFNFKDNKIEKIIPMEKGREVFIVDGKHAGHKGKIEEIVERGGKSIAKIRIEKEKVNVWIKNLIALD